MARDPNARVGAPIEIKTDLDAKKNGVSPPAGYVLGTSSGQYYAFLITHADGHTTVQWLKRGAGGGPGQPDPVELETAGPPSPADADAWAKGEAADAKPDPVATVNGVPSQVIGKDANGQDIWAPVQTPSGPATATTAATQNTRTNVEGTPDPSKPGGADNERPVKISRDASGAIVKTEPLTPAEMQDWRESRERSRNPGGKTDAEIAADTAKAADTKAKADATAAAQQPKRDVQPDPKHPGYVVVTVTTPATATSAASQTTHYEKEGASGVEVPAPAEEAKDTPTTVTRGGKTYIQHTAQGVNGKPGEIYWTDDQGTRTTLPPETSFVGEPAGAPPMGGYGAVTESLTKYRDFLAEQVKGGSISPDQADKLMAARLAQAKSMADEQQGVVSAQTGMAGQQISQRGQSLGEVQSRRGAAQSTYSTVLNQFMPLMQYMPAGGGKAFLDLLRHGMGEGMAQAQAWGGMRDVPEIQYGPAAQAANRAGMPGAPGGGAGLVPTAPPSFMTPYQPQPPAASPPGQAEAAAAAAAAAAQQQASAAGGVPTAGEPGGPPLAPGPVWQPPAQPGPSPFGPEPLAVPGGPGPQPEPLAPYGPPLTPNDPRLERESAPAPVGMTQQTFMQPYAQPQMPPLPGLQMMIDDPSIDNGIVAQAYREVFGQDLPGYGMPRGFGM